MFTRDYAMYAAIFGFFASVWFGWAQEKPPKSWRVVLGIGSGLSFITMFIGIYLAATHWHSGTALDSRSAYQAFGIIFGIEFLSALIGALVLMKRKKADYVSSWIAFVVGVHFIPLASIFHDDMLYVLAAATILGALLPPSLAKRKGIAISALTGLFVGIIILVFGLRGLALYFSQ